MPLRMELAGAAYNLTTEVMRLKKGESVLILADTASNENAVKATADACAFLGAKAAVMRFETNQAIQWTHPSRLLPL